VERSVSVRIGVFSALMLVVFVLVIRESKKLRIAEQEIASGLLDAVVERLVEPLQLIEHLVEPGGDRSFAEQPPENTH